MWLLQAFALLLYRERRLPHPPIWVKVDRHPADADAAEGSGT